jgi:hypothetical protein
VGIKEEATVQSRGNPTSAAFKLPCCLPALARADARLILGVFLRCCAGIIPQGPVSKPSTERPLNTPNLWDRLPSVLCESISPIPRNPVAAFVINAFSAPVSRFSQHSCPVVFPLNPHHDSILSLVPGAGQVGVLEPDKRSGHSFTLPRNRGWNVRLGGCYSRRADLVLFGMGSGVNMWKAAEVYP